MRRRPRWMARSLSSRPLPRNMSSLGGRSVRWRLPRSQAEPVWLSAAAIVTSIALVRVGQDMTPFALHLVFVATLVYWIADARRWWQVRWPSALAADGAVAWLVIRSASSQEPLEATAPVAAALALF